jgi:hypothetical protein
VQTGSSKGQDDRGGAPRIQEGGQGNRQGGVRDTTRYVQDSHQGDGCELRNTEKQLEVQNQDMRCQNQPNRPLELRDRLNLVMEKKVVPTRKEEDPKKLSAFGARGQGIARKIV